MSTDSSQPVATTLCSHCGAPYAPEWMFCGSCGNALEAATIAEHLAHDDVPAVVSDTDEAASRGGAHFAPVPIPWQSMPSNELVATGSLALTQPQNQMSASAVKRRRVTPRKLVATATVLALVALLVAGVLSDLSTRHDRDTKRKQLALTRVSLASTDTQLTSTIANLNATKSDLAARTGQRDNLQAELNAKDTELAGVRGTLTNTQTQLTSEAGTLAELKTCLDGVSSALVSDLNADYSAALAALTSVQTACKTAQAALG
jgi:hypothetical protein